MEDREEVRKWKVARKYARKVANGRAPVSSQIEERQWKIARKVAIKIAK
jgi:hypothetical protein